MRNQLENYVSQLVGQHVIDDLRTVIGQRFNILHMINRETVLHPQGEVIFRKNALKKLAISRLIRRPINEPVLLRTGCPTSRVMYINGIITPYPLALHQTTTLADMLGEPVELVYNTTDGLYKDLRECSEGRCGTVNDVAQHAIDSVLHKLFFPGDLMIVAHSQGAIIMTTALNELADLLPASELKRIHFVTLGAGFGHCVIDDNITTEHLANTHDPVTYLGLQSNTFELTGDVFMREATGHFLIADYLIPMSLGKTYGESLFESRLTHTIYKNIS